MRWHTAIPGLATGLVSVALLAGCSGGTTPSAPPTPMPTSGPTSALVSPSLPPQPSASTGPATPSAPTASPPVATDPLVGQVVMTLADAGLRVRSQPRVDADSYKYEPLLPLGTRMYVLDGPVSASGYAWYEVAPLTSRTLPGGWVAGGGRDGEPWIAVDAFDCPPVPADLRSLAALPRGVGLVCFPRMPITIQARLISCNCDADGPGYSPSWFFLGSGSPDLLVEPGVTSADSVNTDDWFALNLDPTGEHPDVLPVGKVVQVTGVFDHPAAASCTRDEMDAEPAPSQDCRLEFAVTRLLVEGS